MENVFKTWISPRIPYLQSWVKHLQESKEIKQNWTAPENVDMRQTIQKWTKFFKDCLPHILLGPPLNTLYHIFFCKIFDHRHQIFIFGRKTGH